MCPEVNGDHGKRGSTAGLFAAALQHGDKRGEDRPRALEIVKQDHGGRLPGLFAPGSGGARKVSSFD
jgi:hypothetical protein